VDIGIEAVLVLSNYVGINTILKEKCGS
jgi:hypothetical protein